MLIVSFSLPKSATTLLRSCTASQSLVDSTLSVSKIKEPSFFITNHTSRFNSDNLNQILASGNMFRGIDWYRQLFSHNATELFDFSTQYWINPQSVLSNIKLFFPDQKIVAFCIQRDPCSQLLSYVTHLRRGYLRFGPLSDLYNSDKQFALYLHSMHDWYFQDKYSIFNDYNVNYYEFEFDSAIKNPLSTLSRLVNRDLCSEENNSETIKMNPSSSPVIPFLNNILFAKSITNNLKSFLPSSTYPFFISVRKSFVKLNLSSTNSFPYKEADKDFICKTFS